MYYYLKKTGWVFIILITTFACTKQQELTDLNESVDELPTQKNVTLMRLGKKLINPFSIENMQIAMDSLQSIDDKNALDKITIKPTNLYVRFKPDSWNVYNAMMQNQTIAYFNHPLDYEVEAYGDTYRDTDLVVDEPGWLYAVVKPDYTFPDGLTYEVLEQLFIPDNYIEDNNLHSKSTNSFTSALQKLETASFYLTGNLSDNEFAKTNTSKKSLSKHLGQQKVSVNSRPIWKPGGTINVKSDFDGKKYPVPSLKIRVRDWFTVKDTFTNVDGRFKFDRVFNRPVSYACLFDNEYAVINHVYDNNYPIEDVVNFYIYKRPGGRHRGDWNHTFSSDYNENRHFESATIHTAVYDYHNFRPTMNFRPPLHLTIRLCNSNLDLCDTILMNGYYRHFPNLFRPTSSSVPLPAFFKKGGFYFFSATLTDIVTGSLEDDYNTITAKTYMLLAQAAHWQLAKDNPDTYGPVSVGPMVREAWYMGIADRLYREKFPVPEYERLFDPRCNYSSLLGFANKYATIPRDLRDGNLSTRPIRPPAGDCFFVLDNLGLRDFTWNEIFGALVGVTRDRDRGLTDYQKDISALRRWRDNLIRIKPELDGILYDYFDQFL